ncbi:hypothetical protein ACFW9F_01355 [Streptomyces sp. NPDC059506]|uniref:hypothetical protein n=1 Tax=Streptomyces sp. NPDC059506 TaxID=3347751 RepID=UPI0036C146E4
MTAIARDTKEWAGTTEDRHDLHRFGTDQYAKCDPSIRTYSRTTPHDAYRELYMTLRTRAEIEGDPFARMYRFCPICTASQ